MQAALSKLEGIDHAHFEVGKVIYTGSLPPEEVGRIIEAGTPFKVVAD